MSDKGSKYFICEYCDLIYFNTKEEWINAINNFDFHESFCSDGAWSSDVECCIAGILPDNFCKKDLADKYGDDFYTEFTTHVTEKCNVEHRPDTLDEEGYDESTGIYWEEDWSYFCDYKFVAKENKV